jgi:molybdate transport system substrate-binding protein
MRPWLRLATCTAILVAATGLMCPVHAADLSVAVAANFTAPMQKIAAGFEQISGHRVLLSLGSTGGFQAQIRNGAPFQILLAADDEVPARLEHDGHAVAGSRFTYAIGRLVLWSRNPSLVDGQGEILRSGRFDRIAIANPKLAPYGAAAMEVLGRMGLIEAIRPRIVQGDNINQTWQFVATGNASLGFVALSQVQLDGRIAEGSGWIVPENLHEPIRQDAVLLKTGKDSQAAAALLQYLRSEAARSVMRAYGYRS